MAVMARKSTVSQNTEANSSSTAKRVQNSMGVSARTTLPLCKPIFSNPNPCQTS